MKKLMILAVVLAMVVAAAIPALAQDKERDAGNVGNDSGGSVVANPTLSGGGGSSEDGNVAFNAHPADGSSETPVAGPEGASTSGSGSEISVPAPGGGSDGDGGCSDADKIAPRSAPAADESGEDNGSVKAAAAPGCSYVVVQE